MQLFVEKLASLGYIPSQLSHGALYTEEILRSLPELIGSRLPEDYLYFLREFPTTGCIYAQSRGLERAPWASNAIYLVDKLFAASATPYEDLLAVRRSQDPETHHVLFIGTNLLGRYFCLDLRERTYGKIFYWCTDYEIEEGLSLIANSFGTFIDGLQPQDPRDILQT